MLRKVIYRKFSTSNFEKEVIEQLKNIDSTINVVGFSLTLTTLGILISLNNKK